MITIKTNFTNTINLIKYNWKTMLLFEVIYRLFGLAVIFPLATRLFYFSVSLTGKDFITNANIFEYATSPTTILIAIIFILIFGLYVAYEIVALSILFHNNHYENKIGIQTLLITSIHAFKKSIRKYHFLIMLSSLIFLFLVEFLHIVGIASTIQLPQALIEDFKESVWFYPLTIVIVISLTLLFIESIFFEIQCTIEKTSIKANIIHSRILLKKKRIKILLEFLFLNIIMNAILYLIYLSIIAFVALFILIFNDEPVIYPIILTLLYTTYLIVGFFASIVLIPINFAWINSIYYANRKTTDVSIIESSKRIMKNTFFSNKVFTRILSFVLIILSFSIAFTFALTSNDPTRLELFNNPDIISHRGGGSYGPENTLSGIEEGIQMGADAVELDVRFSSDGIPILMHDERLGRTTNDINNQLVSLTSLELLKRLDAGSWYSDEYLGEQIPSLEEALLLIDNRVDVYIEIKATYTDYEDILIEVIENTSNPNNIKIISFDKTLLSEMKIINEDLKTVLLLDSYFGDAESLINMDNIDYFGFKYIAVKDNKELVTALKQSGKGVYVWTVNNSEDISITNNLGVNGIITDKPILARKLIYSDTTKTTYTRLLELLFTRD